MSSWKNIIQITEENYWKMFPYFSFRFPFFIRWYYKRKHKKFNKKLDNDQKLKKEWNTFINEIDKFLAFGE